MESDVHEAASRAREDRVLVEPGSIRYMVSTLREGGTGSGRSLAWFGASAIENQVRGLPGFSGAVFMASEDDRLSFELTQWSSEALFDAACRDDRYADYLKILRSHSTERQHVASADVRGSTPFLFERGDVVVAEVFTVVAPEAYEPRSSGNGLIRRGGVFAHVAPGSDGLVAAFARTEIDLGDPSTGLRENAWRDTLRVVDVVSADPAAADNQFAYRLRSVIGAGSADVSEPSHG